MSLSDLVYLYRARLRTKNVVVQDLFAIAGIAVGVALLFASQVASTSLTHSVQQLSGQIVGDTQYQLDARGPAGVSESLLGEVSRLPGIKVAFPVLEQQANVIGPGGQRSVDLIGTNPHFAHFGGPLLRRFSAQQLSHRKRSRCPPRSRTRLGRVRCRPCACRSARRSSRPCWGRRSSGRHRRPGQQPGCARAGPYAQQITGMQGRVTRVFVQARPGRDAEVQAGLRRLAAARDVTLEPASFDSKLFAVASLPENQSETLFSAISAIVGLHVRAECDADHGAEAAPAARSGARPGRKPRDVAADTPVRSADPGGVGIRGRVGAWRPAVDRRVPFDSRLPVVAFPVGNRRIVDLQSDRDLRSPPGWRRRASGCCGHLRDVFTRPRERAALPQPLWVTGRIAPAWSASL